MADAPETPVDVDGEYRFSIGDWIVMMEFLGIPTPDQARVRDLATFVGKQQDQAVFADREEQDG